MSLNWTVAGPEVARIVDAFEELQSCNQTVNHWLHHEHHPGVNFLLERSEVFGCCN